MEESVDVIHNPGAHRFEARVDGHLGLAEYRLSDSVMQMTHTEVPAALQGRGIAGMLVKQALAHAKAHGLKIDPQCPYVRSYMERRPETHELLAR
ncbi:N-acetyltransferase [Schlegelella sp. S2-27]|uniref:N-acetyltransferase n=1 Tax=Caldimonas mangrovi TaxID=2944811 RepID=A0ABT0YI66_9BURK|nr:GNAT family N-acetyltransferase [Caldimonas mangrovi]MCM5678079.1 N-acetyltransferase [Caldimonas mangrovi]